MKKSICVLLASVMVLALALTGCGVSESPSPAAPSAGSTSQNQAVEPSGPKDEVVTMAIISTFLPVMRTNPYPSKFVPGSMPKMIFSLGEETEG